MSGPTRFPFTEVVGQDDAKLALLLLTVDPLIGGVLLRGDKGSAKTTLARGLADLLPGDAPFVDLPLGATEDRLIGTLDLSKALLEGETTFTPGLLAAADRGVLYVDEINLLADHLVDTLLDVSVTGTNRIERDGISHAHDARFVLIGSMNPEEGELRPQLLDRFGLSVTVATSHDPTERAEAVRRRLAHDRAEAPPQPAVSSATAQLAAQLENARPASIPDHLIDAASRLATAVGAEGLRADIALCRAAAAFAGLDTRASATEDDLRRVAHLVLAHRARRDPFDPPVLPPDALDDALDDAFNDHNDHNDHNETSPGSDATAHGDSSGPPMTVGAQRRLDRPAQPRARRAVDGGDGRSATLEGQRGRFVRDVAAETDSHRPIAVAATVRQVAHRRGADADAGFEASDIRHAIREQTVGSLMILVVDTSGSMGAQDRAEAATGTALGLLTSAYERRDQVAVVTFGGDDAAVALHPTGSVEVARNRLTSLRTGGATPLAAGLRTALEIARPSTAQTRVPFIAVLSDGRATGSDTAFEDALAVAAEVRRQGIAGVALDCETGTPRLGLAARLAAAMGVPSVDVVGLDVGAVTSTIRSASRRALDAR